MSICEECSRTETCGNVPTNDISCRYYKQQPCSAIGTQVGGDHYSKMGDYQPYIVFSRTNTPDEFFGYAKNTAMAYLMRNKKNRRQDVEKAIHTLQLWLELSE